MSDIPSDFKNSDDLEITYEGTPRDYRRTREIYKRWLESGLSAAQFARLLNMEYSYVNKMLKGKAPWQEKYLDNVSKILYCALEDIDGHPKPFIVADISYPGEFEYVMVSEAAYGMEEAPLVPVPEREKENLYVLRVNDNSFLHHKLGLIPGTLLYCAPSRGENLHEGQMVIFVDEAGIAHLSHLSFAPAGHITLEKLNPTAEKITRPETYLRLLDKVVWTKHP